MPDRDKDKKSDGSQNDEATMPAKQDVGPPGERVDDEIGSEEGKKTKRQE